MAFCTKCGAQIPDGAAVCQSCGQAQPGAQQTYQPQQAVPQYNNAGPSLVSQVYGKSKSKLEKLLILFSMIFFALAALALLYYFIIAIVNATDSWSGGFRVFLSNFFTGVYHVRRFTRLWRWRWLFSRTD